MNGQKRLACFAANLVVPLLCAACGGPLTKSCEGECPAPTPGILTDLGVVHKSVWLDSPSVGKGNYESELCWLVDLDGFERRLIFRSSEGTQLIQIAETKAEQIVTFTHGARDPMYITDADGDGLEEFIFESYGYSTESDSWNGSIRYYNHLGDLRFVATGLWYPSHWELLDVDSDGIEEFFYHTSDGFVLRNLDGSIRSMFGEGGAGAQVEVANGADGSVLFLTAATYRDWENGNLHAWSTDGDPLPDVDQLGLQSRHLWESSAHSNPSAFQCPYLDDAFPQTPSMTVAGVGSTYTVSIVQTYLVSNLSIVGPVNRPLRTIMRVTNSDGSLVYGEVLDTGTGPKNVVLLASRGSPSNTLLLVDDDQILAYTFD